jgi:uncharacterized glyoxalase superfamily protein PhnB
MRCQARLAYRDTEAAAKFLTDAFGLQEQDRLDSMVWLTFGKSTMMIGQSGAEHHNIYSPLDTGKPTAEMNAAVDDIDGHYRRAKAAGARISIELEDAPFGQRRYRAIDPEGHGWHFMKPLQGVAIEGLELRLIYADERAAVEFLTRAFGFTESARLADMAWLGFGETVTMVSRADARQRQYGPGETGKPTAMLNLHVGDVDEHYRRALANGARMVSQLKDVPWGFRTYEALDPEGNRWHVMQPTGQQ